MLNFLLVVLWAACPTRFRPMASCLATVWTCIIIVCKMLYQLKVVNPRRVCQQLLRGMQRHSGRGGRRGAWVGSHP